MKLKDQTFAIIAEKKDSISHKWFNKLTGGVLHWKTGNVYIVENGVYKYSFVSIDAYLSNDPLKDFYTESKFEALLKAEQEGEKQKYRNLDELIVPQIIELNQFKSENPNATEKEINDKVAELANKYVSNYLKKVKAEQDNEDIQTFGGKSSIGENAQTFPAKDTRLREEELVRQGSRLINGQKITNPKQITISYNLALEYIAERLNVDKGIIKIEM